MNSKDSEQHAVYHKLITQLSDFATKSSNLIIILKKSKRIRDEAKRAHPEERFFVV